MNSLAPQYRKASLSPEQAAQVEAMLSKEGTAALALKIEILDLGAGCRALSWIGNSIDMGCGKLGHCKLSASQWAECLLAIEQGMRPVYTVRWQVLGKLADGCYGIAGGVTAQLETLEGLHWGELNEMVGLPVNG